VCSDADKEQCAAKSHHSEIEVKREDDAEIERDPRKIEERGRSKPGQEGTYGVEVAERLKPIAMAFDAQRQVHDARIDAPAQGGVEGGADPHEHAGAYEVENALDRKQEADEDRKAHKGRHGAARQDAVVDLEHEQ